MSHLGIHVSACFEVHSVKYSLQLQANPVYLYPAANNYLYSKFLNEIKHKG